MSSTMIMPDALGIANNSSGKEDSLEFDEADMSNKDLDDSSQNENVFGKGKKRRGSVGSTAQIFKSVMTPIKFAKKWGDQLSMSNHGLKRSSKLGDQLSMPNPGLKRSSSSSRLFDQLSLPNLLDSVSISSSQPKAPQGCANKPDAPRLPATSRLSRSHSVSGLASLERQHCDVRKPIRRRFSDNEMHNQLQRKQQQQLQPGKNFVYGTGITSSNHSTTSSKRHRKSRRSEVKGDRKKDKSRKHKKKDKKDRKKSRKEGDEERRRSSSAVSVRSEDERKARRSRSRSASVARRNTSRSSSNHRPQRSRSSSLARGSSSHQLSARSLAMLKGDSNNMESTVSKEVAETPSRSHASFTTSTSSMDLETAFAASSVTTTPRGSRASLGLSNNSRKSFQTLTPQQSRKSFHASISDDSGAHRKTERQQERPSKIVTPIVLEPDYAHNYNVSSGTTTGASNNNYTAEPLTPTYSTPLGLAPPPKTSAQGSHTLKTNSSTPKTIPGIDKNPSSGTDTTRRDSASWSEGPLVLVNGGEEEEPEEADDIVDSDPEETPPLQLSPQDAAVLARARAMEILNASKTSSGDGSTRSVQFEEDNLYSSRSNSRSARQYQHDQAAVTALLRGSMTSVTATNNSSTSGHRISSSGHKHHSSTSNSNDNNKHYHHSHNSNSNSNNKHRKSKSKSGHRSKESHRSSTNSGSHRGRESGRCSSQSRGSSSSLLLPQEAAATEDPTWECPCGECNKDRFNFCGICGGAKPKVETNWECAGCGRLDNEPRFKFCVGCGTQR